MNKIKVSIITSIYNSEQFLKKCIDSYINQTLKDIEIILINDGSKDRSEEICKEYLFDKRIKYFSQENKGKSTGINFGYKKAKGKYILILDSDDYIDLNLCEETYNLAEKENLDIVNFGHTYIKNNIHIKKHSVLPKNRVITNSEIKKLIKQNTYSSKILWFTWSNLIKKELLDSYQILHNENLKIGEDSTFNLECYLNSTKIYSIDKYYYFYKYNSDSLTQSNYKPKLIQNIENQFNARMNLYKKYKLIDNESRIDISRYYLQHSLFLIFNNEINKKNINIKRLIEIKDNAFLKTCLKDYRPSKDCPLRKRAIIWCFKNNLFSLIVLLLVDKKYSFISNLFIQKKSEPINN